MAHPSNSKRKIMSWDKSQIIGGKNKCLLLNVVLLVYFWKIILCIMLKHYFLIFNQLSLAHCWSNAWLARDPKKNFLTYIKPIISWLNLLKPGFRMYLNPSLSQMPNDICWQTIEHRWLIDIKIRFYVKPEMKFLFFEE